MVTETILRLRLALKTPQFTKRMLAEKAKLHPNTLLGCEKDGWNPKASTLIALESLLPPLEALSPPEKIQSVHGDRNA